MREANYDQNYDYVILLSQVEFLPLLIEKF